MSLTQNISAFSVGIILLAVLNIWLLLRRSSLLSAEGGFHINLLVFYGMGPLAYTFVKISWDRFALQSVYLYLEKMQKEIFLCYLICSTFFFFYNKRRKYRSAIFKPQTIEQQTAINLLCGIALFCSVLGYLSSQSDFARSGVGTIFIVLRNLLFPTLVLLIYNVNWKNKWSVILMIIGFSLIGISAFMSVWRSELILFIFSVGAGLMLRSRQFLWLALFAVPIIIIVVLPFQNIKKSGKLEGKDLTEALFSSVSSSKLDVSEMAVGFVAYRLNYARESAYVIRGIDKNYINYRYGETYLEMFYQLIPRILWPDKPSYNYYTGFILPRKIGLSSKYDRYTSWAVNYIGEFLFNFPIQFLLFFFFLYWGAIRWLDTRIFKLNILPEIRMLFQFALFFQVLNTVTVVNGATYFLWIFIVLRLLSMILKGNNKNAPHHESTYLRGV